MGIASRFDVFGYLDSAIGVKHDSMGRSGIQLVCDCPMCGASDRLWVNKRTGAWCCYKCAPGGDDDYRHDIVGLVEAIEGMERASAFRFVLANKENVRTRTAAELREQLERPRSRKESVKETPKVPLPAEFIPVWDVVDQRWTMPSYLRDRGVRARTCKTYDIGFCFDGKFHSRVILPIIMFGEVYSFQARAMGDWNPRYLSPHEDRKSAMVYGLDVAAAEASEAVVAEGPFDVLALHQRGIPAVGILGKTLYPEQVTAIKRAGIDSVVIMLDPGADEDAVSAAALLEKRRISARIASLEKSDPGDASPEDLKQAMKKARPLSLGDRMRLGRIS